LIKNSVVPKRGHLLSWSMQKNVFSLKRKSPDQKQRKTMYFEGNIVIVNLEARMPFFGVRIFQELNTNRDG